MKRRLLFITVVILAVAIFAALVLVRPSLWTSQLLTFFNSQLENRYNLRISASSLSGNILGRLNGEDVIVHTTQDSVLFTAEGLNLQYSLWRMVLGEFALDEISITRPVVYYSEGLQLLLREMEPDTQQTRIGPEPQRQPFTIDRLSIQEGQFIYRSPRQRVTMRDITGDMRIRQSGDALTIAGDFSSLQSTAPQQRLQEVRFQIRQYADSVVLEQAEITSDPASLLMSGTYYHHEKTRLDLQYKFNDVSFGQYLPKYGVRISTNDHWNVTGQLSTDFDTLRSSASFSGQYSEQVACEGDVSLVGTESGIQTLQGDIGINGGTVRFTGEYDMGEGGSLSLRFQDLDIGPFTTAISETHLAGRLGLQERSGTLDSLNLYADLALDASQFSEYEVREIVGEVVYRDRTVQIIDTLTVDLAHTKADLTGTYMLTDDIDGSVTFVTSQFQELADALELPPVSGSARGEFQIGNTWETPSLTGRIRMENFAYRETRFDSLIGYVDLGDFNHLRDGELFVNVSRGWILGEEVEYGALAMEAVGDSILLNNFEISRDENHIYLTGEMSRGGKGAVRSLEIQYRDSFISNRTPLRFHLGQGSIELAEGFINVNDGSMSLAGEFTYTDPQSMDARFDFTDVNLSSFKRLFPRAAEFAGNLNGALRIRREESDQAIQANMEATGFSWKDLQYNRVQIIGDYYQNLLTLNKGYFEHPDGGSLTLSGRLPISFAETLQNGTGLDSTSEIQAMLTFDQFNLDTYSQYIPLKESIAGMVSGLVEMEGTAGVPETQADLVVHQPGFDKISGDSLTVQARHTGETLEFTSLHLAEKSGGIYRGHGTLPLILDFTDPSVRVPQSATMDLRFTASTNRLQFLERYMNDVDAVTGEFDLELSITGTPDNPVRNGWALIRDARLEIATLENEITGLNGETILQNNTMEVRSLTGHMPSAGEREIIEGAFNRVRSWANSLLKTTDVEKQVPNISLSGTLNFEKFFTPGLNLNLEGEDAYIRTLLGEVEGITDADLSISGRDSVRITGTLSPEEVVLRMDFAKEGAPRDIATGPQRGRYMEYDIHTVFPGNVYIKNAQVNAEFEGDIWILRHGREPMNLSGTLSVLRGKFYYYNDTFTIQEGQIYFDPVEFNPQLNIVAETEIEETETPITITLSGELDNPTISLRTSPGYQGQTQYSESELLSLITYGSENFAEAREKVPDQLQSIFTTYLERQLENYGSELIGLETFDVEGISLQNPEDVTVRLGRRVAPNLYFTYQREFFNTTTTTSVNRFGLEYQLNRYMSFIGEMDEDGLYHLNYRLKYNY